MHRVDQFNTPPAKPPAPGIVRFVRDLLSRYPDLSETQNETAWADGPMIGDASGGFIDIGIRWDYYDKIVPFVTSTARMDGLSCFDPQDGYYYPANGKAYQIKKYAVPEPVTDSKSAIEKARRVCGLPAGASGEWHAVLSNNFWHVWLGSKKNDSECGTQGADVARDGSSTGCGVTLCKIK